MNVRWMEPLFKAIQAFHIDHKFFLWVFLIICIMYYLQLERKNIAKTLHF